MQRYLSITANVEGEDLGRAARQIDAGPASGPASRRAASASRRRGQVAPMNEMFASLAIGLAVAVVVILVLLTAYFQSPRLALVSVGAVPGVLSGVVLDAVSHRHDAQHRIVHGHDHEHRRVGVQLGDAGHLHRPRLARGHGRARGGRAGRQRAAAADPDDRLRHDRRHGADGAGPGTGSQMQAPLGRAVIGGLLVSTFATLLILPPIFAIVMGDRKYASPSLHPDDPESQHYRSDGRRSSMRPPTCTA